MNNVVFESGINMANVDKLNNVAFESGIPIVHTDKVKNLAFKSGIILVDVDKVDNVSLESGIILVDESSSFRSLNILQSVEREFMFQTDNSAPIPRACGA